MNRLLDRYLARQILTATVIAVVVLTLVFGLGNIFKRALPQLVDDTLSIERFGQFILYILPFAIAYTVPWGFLSAVLLTFGRLSADNELIAMRMSGRSMWRICLPVFLIAALLSGLCFWLNLSVSPSAKWKMKSIVKDVLSDDPSIIFRQKGVIDGMLFEVEAGPDNQSATNVRIVKVDEFNRPELWAFAKRVDLQTQEDRLTAEFLDVEAEWRDLEMPDVEAGQDPLETYPFDAARGDRPNQPMRPQMRNYPLDMEVRASQPKPNEMTMREIKSALKDDTLEREDAAEYRTELTKRYSVSLACLAFCFVGIPLGVTAQRRETSIGFALSLGVAIAYFLFIFLGETFGEEESYLPHLLMWTPSVLFILLGGFLFHRLNNR